MYIARGDEGFDVASLRQGDILEGVPFPLIEPAELQLLGTVRADRDFTDIPEVQVTTHNHRQDNQWVKALLPVRFGFCAVLSNCCDLEAREGRIAAPVFTLARLHPVPIDIRNNGELFASLQANKDPRNPDDPGYIDYFYLEPHERLMGRDWRVHYNQVTTLPTRAVGTVLLRKKILQLDDRTRVKFKIKLGFTLMRINDEERRMGLENPWGDERPSMPTAPGDPLG